MRTRLGNQPSERKQRIKAAVKLVIGLMVVFFIGQAFLKARQEFAENHFEISQVRWSWLAISGSLYLVGLLPMGLYWYAILRSLRQKPTLGEILRAYFIGHLGKYVPGKAMVVVLRTDLIRSGRVDTGLAAVSVFAETLTMMAVGAALAAGVVAVQFRERTDMVLLALGLMLAAGVPTIPPIFRRVVAAIQRRRGGEEIPLDGLTMRLMGVGWLLAASSWVLLGLSLWATLRAIPLPATDVGPVDMLPRLTACVSLAMVAGFLSMIPGGVGPREWIQIELLSAPFGNVIAIVSAVLLRLVWLLSEILISIILYVSVRKR